MRKGSSPRDQIPICVISAAYPAPSEPTRAIFIENLTRELSLLRLPDGRPKFQIAVVAPRIAPSDPLREARGAVSLRRFRYPSGGKRLKEVGRIPYAALSIYLASGTLAALFEARRIGARAISAHWVLPSGAIGALVSTALGVPLVLHAHGSDIHRYGRASPLARRVVRWIVRRSRLSLAVSGELSRILVGEFGARADRISVLPMGVDGGVFFPGDRTEARNSLGIAGERRELLFVGDLVPEKGALAVAHALAGARGADRRARLNIAGDGPDRPAIESLGREAPERIRWLGRLPPERLSAWYRAADLLILPSRGEGAPVCIMEALASGLPVVATAVGGVPELVRPGIEGWLAPAGASAEDFLGVVGKALADPEALESLRQSLLRRRDDRTARRRAMELGDLLEELVHGSAGKER